MNQQEDSFFPAEYIAANKEQAKQLKSEAMELGLRVDTYVGPNAAEWVLNQVEKGVFHTPYEVISAAMDVFMQLEAYSDLREELFRREIQKSFDDPRPSIPGDEAFARIRERIERSRGRTPPSWVKVPFPE